ncbi:hypothetical protein LXA43DRAFT_410919 [Ganoderma leucocontextum]|nr:hypothetical protein LXA43DRAFT_410919 [Ganoderma leucocontextum]
MTPKDKARAAGISASSFMDLGAELEKQKQEFAKNRAARKPVGRVEGPVKRVAKWAKQNAGVQDRAARDAVFEEPGRASYEDSRVVLERKVKKYELLKKGKTGGYSDKQYSELLVDFEQKYNDHYESDSDEVDESLTLPVAPQDAKDDPLVEYVDELGRTRTVRRSQVPRDVPTSRNEGEDFASDAIYNPVNHFPVYEHSLERQAQILAAAAESPIDVYYDSSREVRTQGGGAYKFSHDPTHRGMEKGELDDRREETTIARQEAGAQDKRVEGMRADEALGSAPARSIAMERRKRELEERKKQLEARKRKKTGKEGETAQESSASPTKPGTPVSAVAASPLPGSEAKGAAQKGTSTKKDGPRAPPPNAADAFLAQLEQDMLKR